MVWIAPVSTRSDDLDQEEREAFRHELAMALTKQKRIEQGGLTISPEAYWTQEKFHYEPQTGPGVDALITDGNGRQVARLRHSIRAAVPLTDAQGQPIHTAGGQEVDSDGYGFSVDLKPESGYREDRTATSRTFLWTFSVPAAQTVPGPLPDLRCGTYAYRSRPKVGVPTYKARCSRSARRRGANLQGSNVAFDFLGSQNLQDARAPLKEFHR